MVYLKMLTGFGRWFTSIDVLPKTCYGFGFGFGLDRFWTNMKSDRLIGSHLPQTRTKIDHLTRLTNH